MTRGARRRGGIRRKRAGWQAYVRLHAGHGGLVTHQFARDTTRTEMQRWIDDQVQRYRRRHPQARRGTLAGDVVVYLPLLANRPALQAERAYQLGWWCDRFGERARWSLQPVEIETALNDLLAAGYAASTVRHYRTALFHLFTKLDGKREPNPLRDVPPPRPADPLPRAIPEAVIDAIFAAMPVWRYRRKLAPEARAAIRVALAAPHANASAIARTYGVSEALVRKLARSDPAKDQAAVYSQCRAQLMVMAYTGLPPAQLGQILPAHVDETQATVLVHGRKKGGGTRSLRVPLSARGLEAFRALKQAHGFGPVKTSTCRKLFLRAIAAMCAALERAPETREAGARLRAELAAFGPRPYDLRHSHLTQVYLASGDIHATQLLAMHADAKMTHRYTLAAVDPRLQAVVRLLDASQKAKG